MALELPGQLRTSMAVPALRSLPPGLGVSGFHQETPQAALSQLSHEQLCAKVRVLEAEIAELRLQAGELPNLRWQISVLVANIERLNNQSSANAQPAAPCNQDAQDQHHDPVPAPLPEPLKVQAASDTSQGRAGLPAQHGKCRIPNPPMSATLGKSIAVIWEEHTVGRPPDFPSVQQLTADHGKKWKAKEFGYNPRVAEKKGVIVKRIKEYIQSYQCDAQQAIQRLEREQQTSGLPLSRFIDSIRPGKGKRKGRDDDGDEAADDGHHSAHQHDPHAALLQDPAMPRAIPLSGLLQQIKADQGATPRPAPSHPQLRTGSLRSSQSLGVGSGTDLDSEGSAPPGSALPAPASVSVSVLPLPHPSLQAQLASAGAPPAAPQPPVQPLSLGFQAPPPRASGLAEAPPASAPPSASSVLPPGVSEAALLQAQESLKASGGGSPSSANRAMPFGSLWHSMPPGARHASMP